MWGWGFFEIKASCSVISVYYLLAFPYFVIWFGLERTVSSLLRSFWVSSLPSNVSATPHILAKLENLLVVNSILLPLLLAKMLNNDSPNTSPGNDSSLWSLPGDKSLAAVLYVWPPINTLSTECFLHQINVSPMCRLECYAGQSQMLWTSPATRTPMREQKRTKSYILLHIPLVGYCVGFTIPDFRQSDEVIVFLITPMSLNNSCQREMNCHLWRTARTWSTSFS